MASRDAEQRRQKIFETVVETYISTGSPVGSVFISRQLRASVSPATIRNIMGELEQAGLLLQPHTSAGRVPTERGYRFYVDCLMHQRTLTAQVKAFVEDLEEAVNGEREALWKAVCEMLARWSQLAAYVLAPTVKRSTMKQIELVPLGVRRLVCVIVSDDAMVTTHTVEMEEALSRKEISALVRYLNAELRGQPINQMLAAIEARLLEQEDAFYYLLRQSAEILENALATEPEDRLYLTGVGNLLAQPEFRQDPERTFGLVQGLDQTEALSQVLRQDVNASDKATIRIGGELGIPGLEECSAITAPVTVGRTSSGGVGILGPKRMHYANAHAMVKTLANFLNRQLNSTI